MVDISAVFANRIGGRSFLHASTEFKFSAINTRKLAYSSQQPATPILDLGIGEPDEQPAETILRVLARESRKHANRVYPVRMTSTFAISASCYFSRLAKTPISSNDEVEMCLGAKSALAQLPNCLLDPGDSIICTIPGYPTIGTASAWIGAQVHYLPLLHSSNFLPDLNHIESIAKMGRLKVVATNYPNNPTGAIASRDFWEKLVFLAHKYNFIIVNDAVYADFIYDGDYCSPLAVSGGKEVAIEVYSLSKAFNMQGLRIGFIAGSSALVRAYRATREHLDNGQFIPIQLAAAEAMQNCALFTQRMKCKYLRRLSMLVESLKRTGLPATVPAGTFYVYCQVPKTFGDWRVASADDFSHQLISKLGIVVVPWDEPDPHIRLSVTFDLKGRHNQDEKAFFSELDKRLALCSSLERNAA